MTTTATLVSAHSSVHDLLAHARSGYVRLSALEAAHQVGQGARIVDIRPQWQRAVEGEIPGSLIVERNHLEWRLHPASGAAVPWAAADTEWIVTCSEGYTSSLAAASLLSIGVRATDLVDGVRGWRRAGLPLVAGPTDVEHVVAG